MANRETLMEWVVDAIKSNKGDATIVVVCKYIWHNHENDLRRSGDFFYTWQYDTRWAAQNLRNAGILRPAKQCPKGVWMLP